MAQIFPDELPEGVHTTRSERAIFEALKAGLPDDFYVYYALPFVSGETAAQGEVDFIILHPELGMLFLECKGGGIERDHDGTWYRMKGKKREKLSRTPAEQAKSQVEALVTKFRGSCVRLFGSISGRFPMVYGWALAFPLSIWESHNIPPDMEPEIFLDAAILEDTHRLVTDAMTFWARKHETPPMLSADQFETFRTNVLSPEIKLVPLLDRVLPSGAHPMVRLTDKQAAVAEKISASKRLMINGSGGTGKTLLAFHSAQMMANEDKRVLLLCHDPALAEKFSLVTTQLARQVQVAHEATQTLTLDSSSTLAFKRPSEDERTIAIGKVSDEPATQAINSVDETTVRFAKPDLKLKSRRWSVQLPGTIETIDYPRLVFRAAMLLNESPPPQERSAHTLKAALTQDLIGPWDAIVVDQGESLSPAALEVLESALTAGGQLVVFYDPDKASGRQYMPSIGPEIPLI